MKIATICIAGDRIDDPSRNADRINMFVQSASELNSRGPLDAILLPGGFFNHGSYIGNYDFARRKKQLEKNGFSKMCAQISSNLKGLVIAGVDTQQSPENEHDDNPDQFCVAWDASGVIGIGKKVFPSNLEKENVGCYIEDYSANQRLVKLKNGNKAILCACYDMFGCADYKSKSKTRENLIQHLNDFNGNYFNEDAEGFENERNKAVSSFWNLLNKNNVKTAFVAIHGFSRGGSENRWQHYGIDGAAKSLGGAVFGAAHYLQKLPPVGSKLTLAATTKNKYSHATSCNEEFYSCNDKALVRIFNI